MKYITDPNLIEDKSMEIIRGLMQEYTFTPEEEKVIFRVVHTTGDPAYAPLVKIHPEAIIAAKKALANGCSVFTDIKMVRSGINSKKLAKLGGEVNCVIDAPEVVEMAKSKGITRSMAAMLYFGEKLNGNIVAIGNAPTALFQLLELVETKQIKPALIIGTPVGFVGARESKEELTKSTIPYITIEGNKGGSTIAATITNALLKLV
ncbi:precorrin-8X methylmutase [Bacillota bacterium LX-D]|nr:precorrin-8X methylmutase [Bacillota bacterium LX-D]